MEAARRGYANLRALFPGKEYVGCDMRPGPGVDRVEDVTAIRMADGSAGTVLCIETFEHVSQRSDGRSTRSSRILRPGGVFVITSPLNFRIHGYPDDYWRMTPNCLRRMLEPYGARVSGYQGYQAFPHTVMGLAIKSPIPADADARASRLVSAYIDWARREEAALPAGVKLRRLASRIYRSKGERRQVADYYAASFQVDLDAAAQRDRNRQSPIQTAA